MGKDLAENWRNISDHLYLSHYEDLCYYYSHNITKKAIREVTQSDALHLAGNYSFRTIHLITSKGRKLFESKSLTHQDLTLEVLHSKAAFQYHHQWKYVLLPDFAEFPLFIALISMITSYKKEKTNIDTCIPI